MKNMSLMSCLALGCAVVLMSCAPAQRATADAAAPEKAESEPAWIESFADAQTTARETGNPILADFTGSDWCVWCVRLKKEVFSQEAFKEYAKANLVLFKADFPQRTPQAEDLKQQNRELATRYGIQGFPTILLLDAGGKELARTGYQAGGAEKYVDHLRELLAPKANPAQ